MLVPSLHTSLVSAIKTAIKNLASDAPPPSSSPGSGAPSSTLLLPLPRSCTETELLEALRTVPGVLDTFPRIATLDPECDAPEMRDAMIERLYLRLDGALADRLVRVTAATPSWRRGQTIPNLCYPHLEILRIKTCQNVHEALFTRSALPALKRLVVVCEADDGYGSNDKECEEEVEETEGKKADGVMNGNSSSCEDVAAFEQPADFFDFPFLRDLVVAEPSSKWGGRPWGDWSCFSKLTALESLKWFGGGRNFLNGDLSSAMPALSGLRNLGLYSARRCPDALGELRQLKHLSATAMYGPRVQDMLEAWEVRDLPRLQSVEFDGDLASCWGAELDDSLVALKTVAYESIQVLIAEGEYCTEDNRIDVYDEPRELCRALFEDFVASHGAIPKLRKVTITSPLVGDMEGRSILLDPTGPWVGDDGCKWRVSIRLLGPTKRTWNKVGCADKDTLRSRRFTNKKLNAGPTRLPADHLTGDLQLVWERLGAE